MLKIVKLTTQELEGIKMLVGDVNGKIQDSVWVYKLFLKLEKAFDEAASRDPDWKLEKVE
jgi:hypothetical protein|tara:strand:+ start:65 stop:244 length:180 start_codon:yes stop_codon:yes gene_type:complete